MADKLVVCFRYHDPEVPAPQYLRVAEAIVRRALDAGGQLVLWGAAEYAFAFDARKLKPLVEMASRALATVPCHGVGIAQGALHTSAKTAGVVTSWGQVLGQAKGLADVAEPGQLLVHPSVKQQDQLQVDEKLEVPESVASRPVASLNLKSPWQPGPRRTAADLGPAPLIGRPDLSELLVRAGSLGLVRAPSGAGGTRFLWALEQHLHGSPVLRIRPHPIGEPLGALSRAIRRAREMSAWSLDLGESLNEAAEALLASEGLDLDTCAELVAAWMHPRSERGASGTVLIDDAAWVDADSLNAVRKALEMTSEPFRLILQVEAQRPVPVAFQSLPQGAEVRFGPLPLAQAETMVQQLLLVDCPRELIADWVRRTEGFPLGLREAILEGLEEGELIWTESGVTGRLEASSLTAEHTIARRLWRLEPRQRAVVKALGVFGGEATIQELSALMERGEESVPVRELLTALAMAQWVEPLGSDLWALPSRTHCRAVLDTLSVNELGVWHSKAAEVLADSPRPMAAARAAVHAALADDGDLAAQLATRAADGAAVAGLEQTSQILRSFASTLDPAALAERGLLPEFAEWGKSAAASRGKRPGVAGSSPIQAAEGASEDQEPPTVRRTDVPSPEESDPEASEPDSGVAEARSSQRSPSGAAQALRSGNVEAMEKLISQLRTEQQDDGLVERLEALTNLARGDNAEALRRLRNASLSARTTGEGQCKAALAYSVALAKVGRQEEALFEALEGLARARELGDRPGEQACVRFLAHLSESVGQVDAAKLWLAAAGS